MGKFEPSIYQQAIFDFIKFEKGSAIVEAVAGSGKTTTIVEALSMIPQEKRTCFLAFNKSIANELKERTPKHVQVMTLNGLGHRAWMRFADNVTLNKDKTRDIILKDDSVKEAFSEFLTRKLQTPVRQLVSIAKAVGLVPDNIENAEGLVKDTDEAWEKIIKHYDIQFGTHKNNDNQMVSDKEVAVEMARLVLSISLSKWNEIDFDDQMYMTVVFNAPIQKFDFVFVDEAQDVSDIQRAMLSMAKDSRGRLIAVGDPCQAIYGFRGADSESLENIAKTFNAKRLPLSISYRCPKKIVKEAQKYVSHIQPSETAIEGTVKSMGIYNHKIFQTDDMVVCRCTAPLIRLAYVLIGNRVSATVLGRDIGKGLVTLIKKLKADDISDLLEKLEYWRNQEVQRLYAKDPESDISAIEDKHEVIKTFVDCTNAQNIAGLIASIESLFGDNKKGGVTLATVHRSKGLESDRVFILDAWLMPLKFAKQPWQMKQERNLQYVATTRAKSSLFYIDSPKKN